MVTSEGDCLCRCCHEGGLIFVYISGRGAFDSLGDTGARDLMSRSQAFRDGCIFSLVTCFISSFV